ncbi:MAG: hypothetical protein WC360_08690, partial [Opitutales bacterium]
MTREEIGIFLNLDESFGWKDVEQAYAQLRENARKKIDNAGSKVERRMEKDALRTIESNADDIARFVAREKAH